jgi:hypothetical protein
MFAKIVSSVLLTWEADNLKQENQNHLICFDVNFFKVKVQFNSSPGSVFRIWIPIWNTVRIYPDPQTCVCVCEWCGYLNVDHVPESRQVLTGGHKGILLLGNMLKIKKNSQICPGLSGARYAKFFEQACRPQYRPWVRLSTLLPRGGLFSKQ